MRPLRITSALTAMLCAAALFVAAGCNQKTEEPRTAELPEAAAPAAPATPEPTLPPAAGEITEDRSVEARDQVAAAEREDLAARQRELDRKEAELTDRARRLRDLERRQRDLAAAEREIERREAAASAPTPAPAEEPEAAAPAPEPEAAPEPEPLPEPEPEPVTVDAGTVFSVELLKTLSSASSRPGETFRARVAKDIRQDGRVVVPAGSEVVGEVTEAVPLRKVGGQAKLGLRFTDLVLPSGSSTPIAASFAGQGKSETGRDAATIGGAAAGGAILGRVLNKGDRSKGAVIGAILGAVVGTAIASQTPGEEVTIAEGAVVDLRLDGPVEVRLRR